jgi:hypothetical protein
MQSSELAYVKATWLKHYKEHSDFARPIRDSIYYPAHSRLVDHILSKRNSIVLIAAHVDEPEVILGFLVYEYFDHAVIHYAYVIARARKLGVATAMLKAAEISDNFVFTHRTPDAKAIQAGNPHMTYDPYRI